MDGRKHGHGIWIINEEKRYVGEFDSGDIHGQGARCFCVCFCLCSLCVPGTLYVHHCCFQGLWHDWTIQKGLAHQLGRGWFEFEFLQGPQDIKYLRNIFDPRPEILRRVQTDDERAAMERLLRQVLEAQDARAVAEKLRTGPCGVINQEVVGSHMPALFTRDCGPASPGAGSTLSILSSPAAGGNASDGS